MSTCTLFLTFPILHICLTLPFSFATLWLLYLQSAPYVLRYLRFSIGNNVIKFASSSKLIPISHFLPQATIMSDNYATLPPQSMPIKHGLSTLFRFTTSHKYRQREMTEMGNEMKGYIIGPMPVSLFLNKFFPSKHTLRNSQKVIWPKEGHFSKVVSCTCETEAYNPFVSLVYYDHTMFSNLLQITVVKQFAPTFEFVNSSTHIDSSGQSEFSFDITPDICVYTTTSKCWGPTDVAHAELLIEFKWHSSDDPFCHPTMGDDNEWTFLHDSKACADTIG